MTSPSELSAALWDRITRRPDAVFWIAPEKTYTYADLADALQVRTRQIGLQPDARVIVALSDDWCAFTTWLAALLGGRTPIMVAPDISTERLSSIAAASEAVKILADNGRAEELRNGCPAVEVVSPASDDTTETDPGWSPTLALPASSIAYILFTSGTTSRPKGVVITHRNLHAQLTTVARVFQVGEDGRLYNGLVLHHVDGLVQGPLLAAMSGGALLRPKAFSPTRIAKDMDWLARERATHMVGAPALYELILRSTERDAYFNRPGFVALVELRDTVRTDMGRAGRPLRGPGGQRIRHDRDCGGHPFCR